MSKHKEFERVAVSGLVNVVDADAVGKVPLHCCHGKWYGPNSEGGFSSYKDTQAGALLGQFGCSVSSSRANRR